MNDLCVHENPFAQQPPGSPYFPRGEEKIFRYLRAFLGFFWHLDSGISPSQPAFNPLGLTLCCDAGRQTALDYALSENWDGFKRLK